MGWARRLAAIVGQQWAENFRPGACRQFIRLVERNA